MDKKLYLTRLLKLYILYAKMDLSYLLRDSRYAIAGIAADMMSNAATLAGIYLLAIRFDGIGAMNQDEILLMLAYITLVSSLFLCFFSGTNTGHISRRIGRGQLDHMMVIPLPMPLQLVTDGFMPFTGSGNLITGIIVLSVALARLDLFVPWWWYASLVMNLILSLFIMLVQSYLFSSAAFYAPVAAEEISSSVIDSFHELTRFPLGGMPQKLRFFLLSVCPAGLLGWYPTMVLLGRSPFSIGSGFMFIVAIILFFLTQWLFRKGWRYYVKTGSIRYSDLGHRR